MGFLADIGRSNVGQTGRSMYNDVLRYGQMERQGNLDSLTAAKAISDMEANKAEEQRRATEFAQQQEQNAEMSRPRPIQGSVHYLMLPEEDREEFVSMMQKSGYVDENGMTSHIRKNQFLTELGKTEEGIKLLSKPFIRQAQMAADKAAVAYGDAVTAGDPDKISAAEKKLKAALLRYETLDKGASAALKSLGDQGKAGVAERRADQMDRRLDETERANLERERIADRRAVTAEKRAAETGSESKEDKRKVKAFTEVRKEVEKAYGFSQFLPSAQDPKLLQKVARGKEIAEDIIDNYKNYGLKSEPKPGTAAALAKKKVDEEFAPKPAAPAEDKKSKSIREILFGSSEKK